MQSRVRLRTASLLALWLTGVFVVQLFVNISGKGGMSAVLLQVGAVAWPLVLLPFLGHGVLPSGQDRVMQVSFAVFAMMGLVSCLVSPIPLFSLGYLGATLLGVYVAMLFNNRFRSRDFLLALKLFSLFCTMLLAAYIRYDYRGFPGYRLGEGSGTMNPNSVGMIAMACVVAAFAYRNLLLRALVAAPALYAIYLTDSRAAGAAMLIALALMSWGDFIRLRPAARILIGSLALLAGAMVIVTYWGAIYDFLHAFFRWDDPHRGIASGGSGRLTIWSWMLDLIRDHLALGVGYRAHQEFIRASSAHNGYLAMLAEVGIVGFLAVMVMIFYRGWSLFRSYFRQRDRLIVIYFGFFTGFLALAMFERYLLNVGNPASLLFLLILFLPADFTRRLDMPGHGGRGS